MSEDNKSSSDSGLGCLGAVVAIMLSVKVNGWTWWALLHGLLGWFYVAYWAIFKSGWLT